MVGIQPDLGEAWGRATVGELSWVGSSGPVGVAVVPLLLGETPCAALPFSHLEEARSVQGRPAAFSVTDVTAGGRVPVAAFGRARVELDVHGSVFVDHLASQETAKHPPTRLRADSLVARRENWWWVARAIITLEAVDRVEQVHGRSRANDALLVSCRGGNDTDDPALRVVTAPAWPGEAGKDVALYPRDGGLLQGTGERAYVFGHQHSPDFERWEQWHRAGTLHDEQLAVASAAGEPSESLRPFGLWARYRQHRAVERACRAGIAAAERQQSGPDET